MKKKKINNKIEDKVNSNIIKQRFFHNVSIELFIKAGIFTNDLNLDSIKKELEIINPILPFPIEDFFEEKMIEREKNIFRFKKKGSDLTITISKGFEETIYVISLFYKKIQDTNIIFKKIKNKINKDDWEVIKKEKYLRTDNGIFYLRLKKDSLKNKEIDLCKKNDDCIKLKFTLALYPNNKDSEEKLINEIIK